MYTNAFGRMVSTDYLVIECAGEGQITLGRSLLELLGANINVGKGSVTFDTPPGGTYWFPRKKKSKSKRGKRSAPANYGVDASSFENT